MRIGINAYEANVSHRVGSNQFAYHVLVQLEKLAISDDVTVFLPTLPLDDMPKEREGWKYRVIKPSFLWSMWRLPLALYAQKLIGKKFDVFYSLGHYAPMFCPFPSVISIMDLAYLKFPVFFKKSDVWKLTHWTASSVKSAAHIIAISEHTKRDVSEYYHKPSDVISVAYPGYESQSLVGQPQRVLASMNIKKPYIAYVGTIQPRKNLVRLIKAFELIAAKIKYKDIELVIAGKVGWLADEFVKAVQHSPVKHRIKSLGFVTDEQKLVLYAEARASVLVGLYEGFGIPPLESLAVGTIPVVSETASLPEVVGQAGIVVDPYSIEDIARGLEEVLACTGREKAHKLEEGKKQVEKFTWEKAGLIVLEALHKVGGSI